MLNRLLCLELRTKSPPGLRHGGAGNLRRSVVRDDCVELEPPLSSRRLTRSTIGARCSRSFSLPARS